MGRLHDPIAPKLHFREVRAHSSVSIVYGVVHAHVNSTGSAQLVAVNPQDGKILKSRNVNSSVFNISLATLGGFGGGDLKAISPD